MYSPPVYRAFNQNKDFQEAVFYLKILDPAQGASVKHKHICQKLLGGCGCPSLVLNKCIANIHSI